MSIIYKGPPFTAEYQEKVNTTYTSVLYLSTVAIPALSGSAGDSGVNSLVHTNSANWDSAYNTTLTLSTYTPLAIYANTSGVYTTVLNNSANWQNDISVDTLVHTNSANWNSAYSNSLTLSSYLTINAAASTYQPLGNYLTSVDLTNYALTSSINNSLLNYTPLSTYQTTSGVYSTVQNTSADWNNVYNLNQLDFTNATTFVGNVTAINIYVTVTLNGSAFKLPLYL